MHRRGITPIETAACLALGLLTVLLALPVGYRHLGKAHRQARVIREWDRNLAEAQEQAVRQASERSTPTQRTASK